MKLTQLQQTRTSAAKGYQSDKHQKFATARKDNAIGYDDTEDFEKNFKGTEKLGSGMFATVFTKPKNDKWIGTARKWVHGDKEVPDQEYSIAYIQQGQGNPFVPVVYSIRKQERGDKTNDVLIDMEKLTPVLKAIEKISPDHPDDNSIKSRLHKPVYDFTGLLQSVVSDQIEDNCHINISDFVIKMNSTIRSASTMIHINGKNYNCKPEFVKCCELIQHLVQSKLQAYYDLHVDNFMVRLTPHGPQLVITDPIAVE